MNNNFGSLGLLYWDMKHGCKYTDWDEEAHTLEEIKCVLTKFNLVNTSVAFHVVVIWMELSQYGIVKQSLSETDHHHIQPIFWYKCDQNQQGATHLRVPVVEVGVIAFHCTSTTYLDLPSSLLDRHNVLVGPGQCEYLRDSTNVVINPYQKPTYLSEYFGRHYVSPSSHVVVLGAGAGGDVQGLMVLGHHIHAIEKDGKQVEAMKGHLRVYKPVSHLDKLVPQSHIAGREVTDPKEDLPPTSM